MTDRPTPTPQELATVWAVALKLYSTSHIKLAEELFPGRHPGYLDEWAERFNRGLGDAVGRMDEGTFARFVQLCLDKYGEEGKRRFGR